METGSLQSLFVILFFFNFAAFQIASHSQVNLGKRRLTKANKLFSNLALLLWNALKSFYPKSKSLESVPVLNGQQCWASYEYTSQYVHFSLPVGEHGAEAQINLVCNMFLASPLVQRRLHRAVKVKGNDASWFFFHVVPSVAERKKRITAALSFVPVPQDGKWHSFAISIGQKSFLAYELGEQHHWTNWATMLDGRGSSYTSTKAIYTKSKLALSACLSQSSWF